MFAGPFAGSTTSDAGPRPSPLCPVIGPSAGRRDCVIGAEDDTATTWFRASTGVPEVSPLAEGPKLPVGLVRSVALAITSGRLIPAAGLHVWW